MNTSKTYTDLTNLRETVEYLVKHFEESESTGALSHDRQFAINILSKSLKASTTNNKDHREEWMLQHVPIILAGIMANPNLTRDLPHSYDDLIAMADELTGSLYDGYDINKNES